jgi:hypothetical protein
MHHRLLVPALATIAAALALAAPPAQAYNGNIPYMMWNTQRALLDRDYSRAGRLITIALDHLDDEGFRRSERFVAGLDERRPEAPPEEQAYIDCEKRFVALRVAWLTLLNDELVWWQEELAKPGAGALGLASVEMRMRLAGEASCLEPERAATEAEQTEGAFARGHELRTKALALWEAEVAAATERRDRFARSIEDGAAGDEAAEDAAKVACLDHWLTTAAPHTQALRQECAFDTDAPAIAARGAFYALRDAYYKPTGCKAFGTMTEFYAAKARWAAEQSGTAVPEYPEPAEPKWFCSTVLEPAWYGFPLQAPE